MLYAFRVETAGVVRTVVAAAETVGELECAIERMIADGAPGNRPDYIAFLTNKLFKDIDSYPFVAEHAIVAGSDSFCVQYGVTVLDRDAVLARHRAMVDAANDSYDPQADQRSIAEIHGLDKHDPWDNRTDEQKAYDAKMKALADKAKAKGDLTGESFAPDQSAAKDDLTITGVRAHQDSDGKVRVDSVMAIKGNGFYGSEQSAEGGPLVSATWAGHWRLDLVGDDGDCIGSVMDAAGVAADRMVASGEMPAGGVIFLNASEDEMRRISARLTRDRMAHTVAVVNGDGSLADHDMSDNPDPTISDEPGVFHKVVIPGRKLRDVVAVLVDTSVNPINTARVVMAGSAALSTKAVGGYGNASGGCWLAYGAEVKANHAERLLRREKIACTVCPVNADGSPANPVASPVPDPDPGPRPWNSRAGELAAMDEDALHANRNEYAPSEFLFCGKSETGTGDAIVHITPRSYFLEHGAMWDQPLGIAHMLPPDLTEIAPGVYRSRSRKWTFVSLELNRAGFRESVRLKMYLNTL